MRKVLKALAKAFLPLFDAVLFPFVYPAAFLLKCIRRVGVHRMPMSKKALFQVGVFPIRNHYYEPLFDSSELSNPITEERNLPGLDWNIEEQKDLLDSFSYSDELEGIPDKETGELKFHFNNESFESGDAEYWYNLIRLKKPSTIIEIGSGYSTLMAVKAIQQNKSENRSYECDHICIEPYEKPWLEQVGVDVVRSKVEDVEMDFFLSMQEDDILFIDSSHVIRPQGDVLFEYLHILPSLNKGVIVHVHDIFSPRDYLPSWIKERVRLWNEQYLLEAFLTSNKNWKIIGALNYLHHNHFQSLKSHCPFLTPDREPGSFYMRKTSDS